MALKRLSKERAVKELYDGGELQVFHGFNYLGVTYRILTNDRKIVGYITKSLKDFLEKEVFYLEETEFTYLYQCYKVKAVRF